MNAISIEREQIDSKIISVSKKRQITIPLKYFKQLGIDSEVECSLVDGAMVIRPLNRDSGEFSVEILKDLISQGYTGDKLVEKFEEQNKNIRKAITTILEEADAIAAGDKKSARFEDIFDSEN